MFDERVIVPNVTTDFFDGVLIGFESPDELIRADAFLDGLRVDPEAAVMLAKERFNSPGEPLELGAAALIFLECGGDDDAKPLLDCLEAGDPEACDAIRRGLRLARVGRIGQKLRELLAHPNPVTCATAFDVLAFHRQQPLGGIGQLHSHENTYVRRCVAEVVGRLQPFEHEAILRSLIPDNNPKVRQSALRAAAKQGMRGLVNLCRARAASNPPCLDSIRFLGVVGSGEDLEQLFQLTRNPLTSTQAIQAIGALGLPGSIPRLLHLLVEPTLNDAAALAIERISGFSVPRGDVPEPPPDATEDELDFWAPPAVAISKPACEWWQENSSSFTDGKRYQAGICVSDDPLGIHFNDLPYEVRCDVYLRERATQGNRIPDWELETWPWHQRNPGWASKR